MSRGIVTRSDRIDEQLPGSVVTLARIDVAAQNHATVEGATDPYPHPDGFARTGGHERTKAVSDPPMGGGTHVAIPGSNRKMATDRTRGTTHPRSGTTPEVADE